MAVRIFFLGASGYVGGTILTKIIQNKDYNVTVSARTQEQADKLRAIGGFEVVVGSLDDSVFIEEQSAKSDVVLNTANTDHAEGTKAILAGLHKRSEGGVLIHISGFWEGGDGNSTSENVYSDLDIASILALPPHSAHKITNTLVFEGDYDQVRTVIISPPTMYGRGTGISKVSTLLPSLAEAGIRNRSVQTVGAGLNEWGFVHVQDLADLYDLVLRKVLEKSIPTGKQGGYFFASSEAFKLVDLYKLYADVLYSKKLVDTPDVKPTDDPVQYWNSPYGPIFGANSRYTSDRAFALGWKPTRQYASYIEEDIDDTILRLRNIA